MTPTASRFVAGSTISPSSALAPSAAARMRWARSTSSAVGVNTSFTIASCRGWMHHFPS